ncbi:hypothetical protein G7046_g1797 [Stylonectria norvegica]|nr:hypothetical protein G7046_g1797 [Stylonectria norvegica]
MVNVSRALLGLLLIAASTDAYWRMSCSLIQTGRVDPIINPGHVAGHVHKVSGASNFGVSSTFATLQASRCTSCEVQEDKSAYWTPQLYFHHSNGSFEMVPNGGTVVYYLGRGENRSKIEPFPPGFKMLTGDNSARSNDATTMTYSRPGYGGRPVSQRVSFACLDSSGPSTERNYMWRTNCNNGMRAQVHFQSCWNGKDYMPDQSHVAYLSQIDNGICPPTHPRALPHIFLEVLYGVNSIDKSKGGQFVFANGDTTGYSFHGDFLNGWDADVLSASIKQCLNNDANAGSVAKCAPLAKSQIPFYANNCPELPPIIDEPVRGMLDKLPGCNQITSGPAKAPQGICPVQPTILANNDNFPNTYYVPSPGDKLGTWEYVGCAAEGTKRTLNKYATASNTLTIQSCTAACKAQGFPLAGMENSRECYCSNALTPGASYFSDSKCAATGKMICAGNPTQYCGAPGILTIWKNTAYVAPAPLEIGSSKIANDAATYAGCFAEATNGRALSSDRTVDAVAMDNEQCVAFCKAGGYMYAGTEYSQECYCGDTIGGSQISDINQCSMKCKGDSSEYCGGGSKLSVWKIDQPAKNNSPATALGGTAVFQGCYTDGGAGGRTLSAAVFTGSTVSIETCASFCKQGNYPLFGMEYSRECYCGYAPKSQATVAPFGDCNMKCAGNSAQTCGGGSRISVWKNSAYTATKVLASIKSNNKLYQYVACYTEGTTGRALPLASKVHSQMTVEMCSRFCSGKAYPWMGIENGNQCYCSNSAPSHGSAKAKESNCNVPCKGDAKLFCGANNRLNVYKVAGAPNQPVANKKLAIPATTKKKMVTTTKKPANPTKKPINTTKKPVTPTKKPVTTTKEPVTPTKKVAISTKKATTPTKKPATPTKKLVTTTKKATTPTKKPVKKVS